MADLWGDDEDDAYDFELLLQDDDDDDGNGAGAAAGGDLVLGANHCLVLLDCGPSMFKATLPDPQYGGKDSGGELIHPVDWSLMAFEKVARDRIRTTVLHKTGKRDGFGVLLYNTRYRPRMNLRSGNSGVGGAGSKTKKMGKKGDDDGGDDREDEDDESDGDDGFGLGPGGGFNNSSYHELFPLQPPGSSTVKMIRNALPDFLDERQFDIEKEYGHGPDEQFGEKAQSPIQLALYEAMMIFQGAKCVRKDETSSSRKYENDAKQIWILTNDDDPLSKCTTSEKQKKQLLSLASRTCDDCASNGIEIKIWPLLLEKGSGGKSAPPFDYSIFYDHLPGIVKAAEEDDDEEDEDEDDRAGNANDSNVSLDDLVSCMQRHMKKTRPLYHGIPFCLPDWREHHRQKQEEQQGSQREQPQPSQYSQGGGGERDGNRSSYNLTMRLDWYTLVQFQTTATKVPIHRETGRVLTRVRQLMLKGTPEILHDTQRIRTYVEFSKAKHRVYITKKEQDALKQAANIMDEPYCVLLGFRPADSVPFFHTLGKSYFAYPTNAAVEGSVEAFSHLHASMLRKGVVAICEFLPRTSTTSRLVAMSPLEEECDEDDGETRRPAGMAVVEIPFEDDMRDLSPLYGDEAPFKDAIVSSTEANHGELVDAAAALVNKLTLKNVVLGENFENAAVVRHWQVVESIALGDSGGERKRGENDFDTVRDDAAISAACGREIDALKALLPEDVEIEKEKKKRVLPPDDSGIDWESAFFDQSLDDFNIPELKVYLRSRGLIQSGRKSDLVARVSKHLESELLANKKVKVEVKTEDGIEV